MTAIITIDELKNELAKNQMKTIQNLLGNEQNALKFLSSVSHVFSTTKGVSECSKDSIVASFMKCAELNIYPSSVSGEAYILPRKISGIMAAQFQLGYKGIVKLMSRSNIVVTQAEIVRENDKIQILGGTNAGIYHEIPTTGKRGEPIGIYVIAKYLGETVYKYMSREEVLEFKKFSQSAKYPPKDGQKDYSPWNPENDPELWMWKKTCLKQLSKTLPQNEALAIAISEDDKEADIKEYIQDQIRNQANRESSGSLTSLLSSPEVTNEEPTTDSTI